VHSHLKYSVSRKMCFLEEMQAHLPWPAVKKYTVSE